MNRRVNICISIALRDFAAFEDLAKELDIKILSVDLDKGNGVKRTMRCKITPDTVKTVQKAAKANPTATATEIKRITGLPHSTVSINRILNGTIS